MEAIPGCLHLNNDPAPGKRASWEGITEDAARVMAGKAKRRQVQRLRASLVGVCSTIRVGNWVPFAFGLQ